MSQQSKPTAAKADDPASAVGTPVTVGNIRRGFGAMIIAVLLLALLNSEGFTVYARDLPGNAFSDAVVELADNWHDLMLDIGLTNVGETVRDRFLSLKETEW